MEKKSAHAIEQDRPDVAASREARFAAQPDLDPERLIFIDETGLSTRTARLRSRCAHGQRLRSGIPHGHWLTTTFVAGSAPVGMSAPMMIDGPMTRDWFLAYVEPVLAPTLRPGDTVILDNFNAHKGAAIQAAIEAVPYNVHTVITDDSTHFTTLGNVATTTSVISETFAAVEIIQAHSFELTCARKDINYRLTKLRPLDEWAGRANEPHDQGRDGQTLPQR